MILGSWRDTVISLWVDCISCESEGFHFLVGTRDALGIGVGRAFAPHFQSSIRLCVSDPFDSGAATGERHSAPILGAVAQQTMLDLVSL